MDQGSVKTGADVLRDLERKGISVNSWAARHGFCPGTVRNVISGRISGKFGQGHKIAVLLGMKDGEIVEDEPIIRRAA